MRYHHLYAALMSAFALGAKAAHAHDHPAHHDHSALPAVVVEQAAAVETFEHDIDMDYLSRTQANDLQDVFRTSPSVQVGTGSRNGQKLFVRGVEDLNVNIKIDGARQGANVFHHQSRVQIDPFILKQVRVYTGPASADAGAGALGGSVVFDTVDAQDLLQPGKTIGARLGGQYESASNLKGGLVSLYGQLGEHLGLLAYGRRNTNENVRAGGGETLRATEGAYEDYLLKASLLDVDGHSLRLSTQRNQNDGGPLRANYPWQTNQGTIRGDDNQRIYDERQALRYAYKPNQQAWLDVQFDMYRSETGLQRFTTNLGSSPNNWNAALTQSHGMDLRNTSRFQTGAIRHALTYGVDYFYDKGINRERTRADLTEHGSNTGLYVQNRMSYGALRLSAGLRQDRYQASYANRYDHSGDAVSPNISGEWDVLQGERQLTLFAGYGESVRGARLNQAGWLAKYTPTFVLGDNGKLKPERAKQIEYGARLHDMNVFSAGDHAGLELTLYNTRIEDYVITLGEGSALTDRIYNANRDVTSEGFEARAHWGLRSLELGLSYSHNRFRGYDGQPGDTTGNSARVGTSVGDRVVFDTLWQWQPNLSLGYTLTGVQALTDVPTGKPNKPGYVVHDINMQWYPQIAKDKLRLTLAVDNLFDTRYAEHSSVRVVYQGREIASWEPGRNVRLGVDVFF